MTFGPNQKLTWENEILATFAYEFYVKPLHANCFLHLLVVCWAKDWTEFVTFGVSMRDHLGKEGA